MARLVGLLAFFLGTSVGFGASVFPGKAWQWRKPHEVGLDAARLEELAKYAGGRGCVARRGHTGPVSQHVFSGPILHRNLLHLRYVPLTIPDARGACMA